MVTGKRLTVRGLNIIEVRHIFTYMMCVCMKISHGNYYSLQLIRANKKGETKRVNE